MIYHGFFLLPGLLQPEAVPLDLSPPASTRPEPFRRWIWLFILFLHPCRRFIPAAWRSTPLCYLFNSRKQRKILWFGGQNHRKSQKYRGKKDVGPGRKPGEKPFCLAVSGKNAKEFAFAAVFDDFVKLSPAA
ncbi:MAG: hypothetical protein K6B40_02695 [Firmicutes bacterium]|nr:hypothetical protein [Bacillota bacterium]